MNQSSSRHTNINRGSVFSSITILPLSLLLSPVVIFLIYPRFPNGFNLSLLLSIFVQVYIALRLYWLGIKKKLKLFHAVVFVFYFASSGVTIQIQELNPYNTFRLVESISSNFYVGMASSVVSLILIDFIFSPSSEKDFQRRQEIESQTQISPPLQYLLQVIAIGLLLVYVNLVSLSALFSTRVERTYALSASTGGLGKESNVTSGLILAACLIIPLCITSWCLSLTRMRKVKLNGLLFVQIFLLSLAFNPITTPRYIFIAAAFAIIFSFYGIPSVATTTVFAVLGIFFAIAVFPITDYYRQPENRELSISIDASLKLLEFNKDFDQVVMGNMMLTSMNPQDYPIGRQLLGNFLFFIPRNYWKDKPFDTSIVIAKRNALPNPNVSMPIWAEGYANFRWPGLIGFPIILGFLARKWQGKIRDSAANYSWMCFFSGLTFIVLRGTLLQLMGIFAVSAFTFSILKRFETLSDKA